MTNDKSVSAAQAAYARWVAMLPTPWQVFYNSGFKQRPVRRSFKTNKAEWAKK